MSEARSVLEGIGVETVRAAAHRAYKGHNGSWDVVAFKEDETANCERMCSALKDGTWKGLIQFVLACEEAYGKEALLPMEEMEVENQCGYIFKGSTNQMEYIESEE